MPEIRAPLFPTWYATLPAASSIWPPSRDPSLKPARPTGSCLEWQVSSLPLPPYCGGDAFGCFRQSRVRVHHGLRRPR
ncbi:MAG: hypothetical protein ACK56F_10135, partial [bacterium]